MWTIQGESGEALGSATRPFADFAPDARFRFESLQVDTLSWTQITSDPTFQDIDLPEKGDTISASLNGVRRFSGIVSAVKRSFSPGSLDVSVEVAGAWHWLDKTPISDLITDEAGDEKERASFIFPAGNLRDHIVRLFDRAEVLDLPVQIGTISDCYDVPKTTISDSTFAAALIQLVRQCPDAITWWDYSGPGDPKFNLTRRGEAEALDLTYSVPPLSAAGLAEKEGFRVEYVDIQFAERDNQGRRIFKTQSHGTPTLGAKQVVVTSGDSLVVDALPPDPISELEITSESPFSSGTTKSGTAFLNIWPFMQKISAMHSDTQPTMVIYDSATHSAQYDQGIAPDYFDVDGNTIDDTTTARYMVRSTNGDPLPQWLIDDFGLVKGFAKGTWCCTLTYADYAVVWNEASDLEKEMIQAATASYQISAAPMSVRFFFDVEFDIYYLDEAVTAQTYYQALAYQFEAPPEDLARNLYEAQNWTPYVGDTTLIEEIGGTTNPLGKVLNISGSVPAWGSMRALIQGCEFGIFDGVQTVRTGAPQRLGEADILSRLRTSAADSITLA